MERFNKDKDILAINTEVKTLRDLEGELIYHIQEMLHNLKTDLLLRHDSIYGGIVANPLFIAEYIKEDLETALRVVNSYIPLIKPIKERNALKYKKYQSNN